MAKDDMTRTPLKRCSFCGKTERQVMRMVAGANNVCICNECIMLCQEIISDAMPMMHSGHPQQEQKFDHLPSPAEMKQVLDDYVIGQEHAKRALCVAVYNHYKRIGQRPGKDDVELQKSNILMVGPTGCGKTFLAQTLARILNVPFAIADATSLTEAGYVGEDVENILLRLIQAADYDIDAAQRGIIYIDEIDKICKRGESSGPDVSREGVQRDLLPLVEGCTVSTKHGMVKTDHILFIASGAFQIAKPSDLIPELQGRLPIRVELQALTTSDFERILTEPNASITVQYKALMATEGVNIEFTDSGIKRIAEAAWQVNESTENIGARRLHTVLERLMEEISYDASDLSGQNITIDADYVSKHLDALVADEDLSRFIL